MVRQRISLKDIDIAIDGKIVGGAETLAITIKRDDEVAYEGGNYMPVEIVGGKYEISGSIDRAFIDVSLLKQLMPVGQAIPPRFTLTGVVTSGKTPSRNMTIFDAVFDSIDINGLGLTGFAKNKLDFNALGWRFD